MQKKSSLRGGYEDKFVASRIPKAPRLHEETIHTFESPPLLQGLSNALKEVLGKQAQPTPIQVLSLNNYFFHRKQRALLSQTPTITLMASETGSGKSIAYLLPVLQSLKETEKPLLSTSSPLPQTPRAVILAPTHELCRQLSAYAKSLSHEIKIKTVCFSNPSKPSTSAIQAMRESLRNEDRGPSVVYRQPDVIVSTPSRLAHLAGLEVITDKESPSAASRPKKSSLSRPEVALDGMEWLVIDEADVLFDRDFRQTVEAILASRFEGLQNGPPLTAGPRLNIIVSTATVPQSLNKYLMERFPNMTRLTSPNLHQLPKRLRTERVVVSGTHPFAVMHKKLVEIFAADSMSIGNRQKQTPSRVIVFCNRSERAEQLASYLKSVAMSCFVMTSSSAGRRKGSNNHIAEFLTSASPPDANSQNDAIPSPRVLITTSLLARGLDFASSVTHVLIADEPRNEIDFLHRAGRTGRRGRPGTVVLFGKVASRGPKRVGFT
ncbi:P-loop containing nucleoside triphosphate hydrolase protein [Cantharellus anzutake]|uniref:P-loop containing nucleoside triphosphate hydrolase protein n=1 Tax=Cantharellus anzutake TaxID=1750568 RepID=UPI0019031833|nr:P-loop containing nucleoside triphosphate hydrolase protein [Cantharellus anzutake]KAF8340746.1 P-loop containing nucleoside triphosphate hydrolase protein [Cantharellus anzutake]